MSIYLFDKLEKLVDIVESDLLIEWTHTVQVNAYEQASFELPVDYNLNDVDYFGFFHTDETFRIFRVTEKKRSDVYYVEGIDKAESDLRTVTVIEDKRPQNATADQALYTALEGTGYEVGMVSGLPEVRSLSFYYISPAEALTKIIETYGCEFRVRYTFVENRITSRYIDLAKRFGKVSGKQFLYGDNALSIEHEETADDVVTALIGRGKGEETVDEDGQATGGYGRRIEFTDVVWSKKNGNPVDKPSGRNYIVSETARQAYGLSQDGQLRHRWGVFVDEKIEDKAVLLQRTYEELQKLSVPITTFKASILAMNGEADYGDSVAIIRDEIGIAFEARLHKVVYDKLDSDRTTVELGDYATLQARRSKAQSDRITEAIDGAMSSVSAEMEAFNRMVDKKIATKNAEIDDALRVAQLNMDNALELAKVNAENYANNIKNQIDAEFDVFEKGYEQETARQNQAIDNIIATANAGKNLAEEAKRIGEQAKTDAASALTRANQAKTEAIAEATRLDTVERQAIETKMNTAKNQAIDEANRLVETAKGLLSGQVNDVSTELTKTKESIKLLANQNSLDELKNRVSTAESILQVQADQILQRVKTSDFDQAKQRLNSAESSITQLGNRITNEISETVAKIPQNISHRNLATGSSENWSRFINFTNSVNARYQLGTFAYSDYNTGLYPGTQINLYVLIRVDNVVLDSNISSKYIKLQSFRRTNGTDVWDNQPFYNKWSVPLKAGNNYHIINVSDVISDIQAEADTFTLELRVDGAASCDIRHRAMTVTLGDLKPTYWVKPIDDLVTDVTAVKTSITQTASGVEQLSTKLTETEGKVTSAETSIRQLVNDVSSKVSQTTFDNLKRTVDSQGTAITQNQSAIALKAEKTYVDNVKSTADSALSKANSNASQISTTRAELQVTNQAIETKASKTDVNNLTGRLNNAETTIRTQAGLIEQRLTSTQVEQAIKAKGYATTATLENKVKETADSFSRTISETKALIPSELSGNLLLKSNVGWSNAHDNNYVLADKLEEGKTYTLVSHYWHGKGATAHTSTIGDGVWNRLAYNPAIDSWMVTFQAKANIPAGARVYLASHPETALGSSTFVTLVKGTIPLSRWEPAYSELATVSSLHEVKDTVDSHTRTISDQGTAISQVVQTATGIVSRVGNLESNSATKSDLTATQSQVSQLAGSYAIKNLTSNGQVLNQINLLANGNNRIDGRLTHITGNTLIDNAVIKSAMVDKLKTANFEAGSVTASIVASEAVTSEKLKVDQGLFDKLGANEALLKTLFAKNAFITSVQAVAISANQIVGGVIKSTNNSIFWDLNDANLVFNANAKVVFNDVSNTISYTKNGTTGLLKFNNANYNAPEATFGVNRNGDLSSSDGVFSGIRVRGFKYTNGSFIDEVYAIGDDIYLTGGYGENNGFRFSTAGDELGFYPRANRQYALGSPNLRFTTLYLDEVNLRVSSTKSYNLRDALGKLAAASGISL